jgi:hypothetical protein
VTSPIWVQEGAGGTISSLAIPNSVPVPGSLPENLLSSHATYAGVYAVPVLLNVGGNALEGVAGSTTIASVSSSTTKTDAQVNETLYIQVINATTGAPIDGATVRAGPASSANDFGWTPVGPTINECVHGMPSGSTVLLNGTIFYPNGTLFTPAPCPLMTYTTNSTGWVTIPNQDSSYFFIYAWGEAGRNYQVIPVEGSSTFVTVPLPMATMTVTTKSGG